MFAAYYHIRAIQVPRGTRACPTARTARPVSCDVVGRRMLSIASDAFDCLRKKNPPRRRVYTPFSRLKLAAAYFSGKEIVRLYTRS